MQDTKEIKLTMAQYSERALVVRGDTKPLKDKLKSLGGKFNPNLKGGAGWIFSIKHMDKLRNSLGYYLTNEVNQ